MHVLIVTYHAPTPEVADAGPLLSGRVSQVSTMTLDALIPRVGDVPLESAVQRACNMAFTFAPHVEAHEIWLRTDRATTPTPIAMRFGRHMASLGMQKMTLVMLIKM